MSQLRVAVIGAGHLGKIHARLLSTINSVDLVAVVDPSPSARRSIQELLDVTVMADYRQLLHRIDAAVIATPTRFHFEVASQLLKSEVHCLIEKPLTDSVTDAIRLVDLAEENACVVSVGHCERFNAAIQEAQKTVGEPKFVQSSRMSGYTFRSTDIGVVHDLMIHDIDLVNSMFPGNLVDVRAIGISVFGKNEDIAQARLQFSCGGVANITSSRCSFVPERSLQIFGTEGYAKVNLANQSVDLVQIPSWIRNRDFDFDATTLEQQAFVRDNLFSRLLTLQQTEIEPNNAILAEQNDWLDAIRSGSKPRVDVEQGKQAVEIAQQVLDSIARHNWSTTEKGMTGPLASSPSHGDRARPDSVRVSCFVAESCVEAVLSTQIRFRRDRLSRFRKSSWESCDD